MEIIIRDFSYSFALARLSGPLPYTRWQGPPAVDRQSVFSLSQSAGMLEASGSRNSPAHGADELSALAEGH